MQKRSMMFMKNGRLMPKLIGQLAKDMINDPALLALVKQQVAAARAALQVHIQLRMCCSRSRALAIADKIDIEVVYKMPRGGCS